MKVCWNCKQFDSFGCVCHFDGKGKDVMDTCDEFGGEESKEEE